MHDINVADLKTNFIDTKYGESEDEDDYNTTLAWCCSNNTIRYLQEHMNIEKETLEDLNADYNVNKDF